MVRSGEIGKVRLVVTNFSHGHHSNQSDADNPRVRWRYDPTMAGVSGQFADCYSCFTQQVLFVMMKFNPYQLILLQLLPVEMKMMQWSILE